LPFPWRERGIAAREWLAAAYVGCCVCVVCFLWLVFYPFCRVEHPTMLILFPHFNARSETVMSHPSTTDRLAYKGGVSVVFGMGGGATLGLRF
jgi:hypothetical protein